MLHHINSVKVKLILFNSSCSLLVIITFLLVIAKSASAQSNNQAIAERTLRVIAQSNFVATTKTSPNNNQNIFNQGQKAYQAGRYTEAKILWEQAYQEAQAAKQTLAQAQSLNCLALADHKLGEWQLAEEHLRKSLKLLQNQTDNAGLNIKAQTFNTQGRLKLARGNAAAAIVSWQQAAEIYRQVEDDIGALGVEINQAQAWQSLGLYRRAQKALRNIVNKLEAQSDKTLKITGLRSLGMALQVTGDLKAAQDLLKQSLALSEELNLTEESSSTLFSLGNIALAAADQTQAVAYYQKAAATTAQPLLKTEARLNQLGLLIDSQQWQSASQLILQIKSELANLTQIPSRRLVYVRVNLAKHLIEFTKLTKNQQLSDQYYELSQSLLKMAIEEARKLEDKQAKSFALGMLGHLYQSRQPVLGRKYTQQAVQLATEIHNLDLTYQWQWQLGRLLQTEGNLKSAIASYTEAVNALESLRSDLIITNSQLQFSFRESIEPVYRELVSLLLTPINNQPVSQDNLRQARNTIEALQLAELNNFFREACLDTTPTAIDQIDRQAAVIYPIILSDRLEVIVSLPDKTFKHYAQPIPQGELESVIEKLRQTLQIRSRRQFYTPAQKLYTWLIRPILTELSWQNVETIVFIPDGSFRNIPLATLHDGKQYLIEQYNVALTPGLQLLAPLPLEQVEPKTLAAGITQRRRGFSALKYVAQELQNIQSQTDSVVLQDEQFTKPQLAEKIKTAQYPIVHIATHGQFSSNLSETFLLAWDSDISIGELETILSQSISEQQAIELLILSACETARGDKRAALGLAGMAVKAGARTTLATLWTVYDQSTAMTMNYFYQNITKSPQASSLHGSVTVTRPQNKRNKAKALRQAQLNLINSAHFKHPFYWSPFVMVGNWL